VEGKREKEGGEKKFPLDIQGKKKNLGEHQMMTEGQKDIGGPTRPLIVGGRRPDITKSGGKKKGKKKKGLTRSWKKKKKKKKRPSFKQGNGRGDRMGPTE